MLSQILEYHGVEISMKQFELFGFGLGQYHFRKAAFLAAVSIECHAHFYLLLLCERLGVDVLETAVFVERQWVGFEL